MELYSQENKKVKELETQVKTNTNKLDNLVVQELGDNSDKVISQQALTNILIKEPAPISELWAGYQRNVTDSQAEVTRIAGRGQMDYFFAQGGGIFDGFKGVLLNSDGTEKDLPSGDWSSATLDGTAGNILVKLPRLYTKYETDGDIIRFKVSLYPLSGFTPVKNRRRLYVGSCEATVDRTLAAASRKLMSVCNPSILGGDANSTYAWCLGGRAATSLSLTQFRALARANGANYFIQDWNTRNLLYNLFIAEYGTLNSQAPVQSRDPQTGYCRGGLGNGVTNISDWTNYNGNRPIVPCGASNSLGNGSGEVAYNVLNQDGTTKQTVYVPRFHGIENPFGDVWEFIDGVHLMCQSDADGGKIVVYANDDISTFQDTDNINYEKRGEAIQTNGYVSKMLWGDKGDMIATEVNGGSSTYYCDYFYINKPSSGTQLRAVLVGGSADSGVNAGLGYVRADYVPAVTGVDFGSRLCYLGSEND